MKKNFKTEITGRSKKNSYGFRAVSSFLGNETKRVTETRGFTIAKVLTHWEEIVGSKISTIAIPVKVGHEARGLGSTLTILCVGAHAPMLQTMLPEIRDKVNSVYGYSAISRVRITQTDSLENLDVRDYRKEEENTIKEQKNDIEIEEFSNSIVRPIRDQTLRKALQNLGKNVLLK